MSKISDVVRGNVSSLFGRFRPPQGKSQEEILAAKAERLEFGDRLIPMLKLLGDDPKTERAIRQVFREIQGEPTSMPMPTPDGVVARVRRVLNVAEVRPDCPGCVALGGVPGIFADTPVLPTISKGELPIGRHWLCPAHHEVVAWYAHRQSRYADGLLWYYPPPVSLIPRDNLALGQPVEHYYEYTDGALISALGLWARDFVESLTGESLLDEPRPRV